MQKIEIQKVLGFMEKFIIEGGYPQKSNCILMAPNSNQKGNDVWTLIMNDMDRHLAHE